MDGLEFKSYRNVIDALTDIGVTTEAQALIIKGRNYILFKGINCLLQRRCHVITKKWKGHKKK